MNADKRWENAAERCRKAANSYYNRGLVRARERDLSGAAPLLKRALELDKTHMEARNLLGLVFYESGEVGDALVQWVISMGLQPENNPAIRYLDDIRRKSGRIRTYARQIQRYNAALELAKHGVHDTAIHQLSGVLSQHPNYVRAGLLLSLLLMEAEDWTRAEHYLKQVQQTDVGNPQAARYLLEVQEHLEMQQDRKDSAQGEEMLKNAYSHRQMTDDDVIIPSSYRESTGWQTVMNIGIGLLIGAAAVLFLYMPTKTAELSREHNQDLIAVSEKLSAANHEISELKNSDASAEAERGNLINQLNTIEEDYTYKLSQYQKLIGILDDYRSNNYSHAADLFATIDTEQLTDVDDESDVSVTEVYNSIAGKMRAEGYLSLYGLGDAAYDRGEYESAINYYVKALAINPDYEPALFKQALTYKVMGDIQSANNLFGEVILRFPDTELARRAQQERGY